MGYIGSSLCLMMLVLVLAFSGYVGEARAEGSLDIAFMRVPDFPPHVYTRSTSPRNPVPLVDAILVDKSVMRGSGEGGVYGAPEPDPRPGFWETSEYMMGDIGVLIVFVESDGSIDPNVEDWTQQEVDQALSGILRGLHWWKLIYPWSVARPNFFYQVLFITTGYEPANHGRNWEPWMKDVLDRARCGGGENIYEHARRCANIIRQVASTDWAFIIFVVDDSKTKPPYERCPTAAFLGGPALVVTYNNCGWGIENMDRVLAHEVGHIFWATDEYDGKPEKSGYLYAYETEGSGCIMDTHDWCISPGTMLQIGWKDSDNNGYPDILENEVLMEIVKAPAPVTDETPIIYEGYFTLKPYQCLRPGCRSVTINKVTEVTTNAIIKAEDGAFDSAYEEFTMTFMPPKAGKYDLVTEVRLRYRYVPVIIFKQSILYTYLIVVDSMRESVRPRLNVGATERVGFRLVWAHDNSPVKSGRIWIEDVVGVARGDGWFYATVTSSSVGMSIYEVSRAEVFITTDVGSGTIRRTVMEAEPVKVIWDRVSVELLSERRRVDVGSEAPIRYRAYYEYDGAPFQGVVYVNQELRQSLVGKYTYVVYAIEDYVYGLTAFKSNSIDIIFDKVIVSLTAPRTRIDVGSRAPIQIDAKYAYDGARLDGEVLLSESLVQNNVGEYTYRAVRVVDNLYGLSVFESNEVTIVFDRVVVELQPLLERVQVGKKAEFKYKAYYEYDGQPFRGDIRLNRETVSWELGPVEYYAAEIIDSLYGLRTFKANSVTIIFDRIKALPTVYTLTPFIATASIKLSYEYDYKPVREAFVTIMGKPAEESFTSLGTYSLQFPIPLPLIQLSVSISKEGFDPINLELLDFHIGNTTTYLVITAVSAAMTIKYKQRKSTKPI